MSERCKACPGHDGAHKLSCSIGGGGYVARIPVTVVEQHAMGEAEECVVFCGREDCATCQRPDFVGERTSEATEVQVGDRVRLREGPALFGTVLDARREIRIRYDDGDVGWATSDRFDRVTNSDQASAMAGRLRTYLETSDADVPGRGASGRDDAPAVADMGGAAGPGAGPNQAGADDAGGDAGGARVGGGDRVAAAFASLVDRVDAAYGGAEMPSVLAAGSTSVPPRETCDCGACAICASMRTGPELVAELTRERSTSATVRCWVCRHDVPEVETVCMAGVGTSCRDGSACRARLGGDVPGTSEATAPKASQEDFDRLFEKARELARENATLRERSTDYAPAEETIAPPEYANVPDVTWGTQDSGLCQCSECAAKDRSHRVDVWPFMVSHPAARAKGEPTATLEYGGVRVFLPLTFLHVLRGVVIDPQSSYGASLNVLASALHEIERRMWKEAKTRREAEQKRGEAP